MPGLFRERQHIRRPLSKMARVDPAWVEIYGHMNISYYVMLFDLQGHEILAHYGLGEDYTE